MARKPTDVVIGQRFREVGRGFLGMPMPAWTVDRVFTSTDSLRYARLVSAANASEQKTLAVHIITNRKRYIPEIGTER
jgi:hypothetical protein